MKDNLVFLKKNSTGFNVITIPRIVNFYGLYHLVLKSRPTAVSYINIVYSCVQVF